LIIELSPGAEIHFHCGDAVTLTTTDLCPCVFAGTVEDLAPRLAI
jgi:hypothetical protein